MSKFHQNPLKQRERVRGEAYGLGSGVPWVPYRQEETAVLLQSAQEAQEGNARDDDAADQQHVGRVEARHGRSELGHSEVHHHVYTEAQHGHPTHLTGENTHCSQVLPHTHTTHSSQTLVQLPPH